MISSLFPATMVSASANKSTKKRKDSGEEGAKKAPRVVSCVECRRRKLRCSREEKCDQCVKSKRECVWDEGAPSRTEEDAKIEASQAEVLRLSRIVLGLEERLARLEQQQESTSTSPTSPSTPGSSSSHGSLRSAFDSVSLGPRISSSIHICSRGSVVSSLDPVDRACTNPMDYPSFHPYPAAFSAPAFVSFSQPPTGIPFFPSQPPSAESLPPSLSASSSSSSLYSTNGIPSTRDAGPSPAAFGLWTMFAASEPSAQGMPTVQEKAQEDGKQVSHQ